jgi:hypothetical protein
MSAGLTLSKRLYNVVVAPLLAETMPRLRHGAIDQFTSSTPILTRPALARAVTRAISGADGEITACHDHQPFECARRAAP